MPSGELEIVQAFSRTSTQSVVVPSSAPILKLVSVLPIARFRQQTVRRAALERQLADQSAELARLFGRQSADDQQPAPGSDKQPAAGVLRSTCMHDAACQADFRAQLSSWEPGTPPEQSQSTSGDQQLPPYLLTLHSHQAAQRHGQQPDEVAAAAQQIAYHAGAASLARQGAITLQEQVCCKHFVNILGLLSLLPNTAGCRLIAYTT
jgi:hypothetical protein